MSRRALGVAALMLAAGSGVSCSSDRPMGPQPGPLRVVLTAPAGNTDGAILFTVSGAAAPTSATAGTGMRVFHQALGATTRFIVTGTLATSQTILTIQVPDRNQPFAGGVEQVAATNYQLRASLAGYGVAVVP